MRLYLKLCLKCICVMVPFFCFCLWARINMMGYADQEAPYYMWNKNICNTLQSEYYDIIILGDSACNGAYAPELLSGSTLSLALGGTTPVENYYVLKEYLEYNRAPEKVYISFADSHLTAEDCFYYRIMYTHRFKAMDLFEILSRAKFYNESSIITDTYLKDFWSYELYLPNKYITSIISGGVNQRLDINNNAITTVELHRGRYISVGMAQNGITDIELIFDFTVAPLFDEYYRKIIELCADNSIDVRIIKLPMDEHAEFTEAYEDELYAYYNRLMDDYSNVTFEWIKGGYGQFYFQDFIHANNHGARMFSEILKAYYPEDFSETISDEQYMALDNDIQIETDFKEIFQWIKGKEYTIILYDGTGEITELFENEFQNIAGVYLYESDFENVFFIKGNNDENTQYDFEKVDDVFMITTINGLTYEWNPLRTGGVGIVVMNDRMNMLVCKKNFAQNPEGFSIE